MDNTRNPITRQFEIAVWSSLAATAKRLQRQPGNASSGSNRRISRSEIKGAVLYAIMGLWIGLVAGILVVWVILP